MARTRLSYAPWRSLDAEKRYCLVDVMLLLEVYRRNARLAAVTRAVLHDRTALIIPEVVDECYSVFHASGSGTAPAEPARASEPECIELFDNPATRDGSGAESKYRQEFDLLVAEGLDIAGIRFASARPEPDEIEAARNARGGPYKGGRSLSGAGRIILGLAAANGNVDVLTDDAKLAEAALDMRPHGRVSNVLDYYFSRIGMTARFLGEVLDLDLECRAIRDRVEYRVARAGLGGTYGWADHNMPIFYVDYSPNGMSIGHRTDIPGITRNNSSRIVRTMYDFFKMAVSDWYCACNDPDWIKFDKKWHEHRHGLDASRSARRRNPYYAAAKSVLDEYRYRHCACTRPG